ncbi:MAG: NUDIX hydrolase [Gammaproteobacteria bacterium]|nr:NUDIX hydrolase [Gammaproteobacteria bacterium]
MTVDSHSAAAGRIGSARAGSRKRTNARPRVVSVVVVFTLRDQRLKVLLSRVPDRDRSELPTDPADGIAGDWTLPASEVAENEALETCALRALEEGTGLSGVYLEQLYTFGEPGREPHRRTIAVSYYALVPSERLQLRPPVTAAAIDWFALDTLPPLVFDHGDIVRFARARLAAKLDYSTIALQFMPATFTLSELQQVYEQILDEPLDKRNFRKRILALDQLDETGQTRRIGTHRPARLYKVRHPGAVHIIK